MARYLPTVSTLDPNGVHLRVSGLLLAISPTVSTRDPQWSLHLRGVWLCSLSHQLSLSWIPMRTPESVWLLIAISPTVSTLDPRELHREVWLCSLSHNCLYAGSQGSYTGVSFARYLTNFSTLDPMELHLRGMAFARYLTNVSTLDPNGVTPEKCAGLREISPNCLYAGSQWSYTEMSGFARLSQPNVSSWDCPMELRYT